VPRFPADAFDQPDLAKTHFFMKMDPEAVAAVANHRNYLTIAAFGIFLGDVLQ